MGCGCGSGAGTALAYKMLYTDSSGTDGVSYVLDLGSFRAVRAQIEGAGGTVRPGIQVSRKEYDAWIAEQQPA